MFDTTLDLTHVLAMFSMLMLVIAVTAMLLALTDEQPVIPEDVIQEMVLKTISEHNLAPLSGMRLSSYFKDPRPMKKPKQIRNDRERAHQCVMYYVWGEVF
jgi:hypothetical protein